MGFVVQVDQLLNALSRQKIEVAVAPGPALLLYRPGMEKEAIGQAVRRRAAGQRIALLCMEEGRTLKDYKAYAERNDLSQIFYVDEDGPKPLL